MDDLAHYNTAMAKSLDDKLFFLNILGPTVFVDFGCANGALMKAMEDKVAGTGQRTTYIGVDNSEFQLSAAAKLFPKAIYAHTWEEVEPLVREATGLKVANFSSVLHEAPTIGAAPAKSDLFDAYVMRDMGMPSSIARSPVKPEWVAAVKARVDPFALDVYEGSKEAHIGDNTGLFTEFLLKYPYLTEGFEIRTKRELSEDYLLDISDFLGAGTDGDTSLQFFSNYSAPWVRDRIMRDFGFFFPHATHWKCIVRRTR